MVPSAPPAPAYCAPPPWPCPNMTAVHPSEPTSGGKATVAFAATIVFLSSAFIMTLELVAARLVAQHLGVSLYTWTAVIGVILAGITVGNYVGGKLADIYEARGLLTSLRLIHRQPEHPAARRMDGKLGPPGLHDVAPLDSLDGGDHVLRPGHAAGDDLARRSAARPHERRPNRLDGRLGIRGGRCRQHRRDSSHRLRARRLPRNEDGHRRDRGGAGRARDRARPRPPAVSDGLSSRLARLGRARGVRGDGAVGVGHSLGPLLRTALRHQRVPLPGREQLLRNSGLRRRGDGKHPDPGARPPCALVCHARRSHSHGLRVRDGLRGTDRCSGAR